MIAVATIVVPGKSAADVLLAVTRSTRPLQSKARLQALELATFVSFAFVWSRNPLFCSDVAFSS